jgi:hypothetical protein
LHGSIKSLCPICEIPQIASTNNGTDDGIDMHPSRRRTSVSLFDHFIGTDE